MGRGWKILVGGLVALAAIVVVNALVVSADTEPAEVTAPGGRIFELRGGDIQVVDRGPRDGSPIVLIHCFTCSLEWWDRMAPMLERRHRVVRVDLLGHGGSEKPTSGYSIEGQADLVAQALDRLDVSSATVVGHSLGGPVSIALAEQSPSRVDRLVTIGSSPDFSYGELGFVAELPFRPVIGQALWRFRFDSVVRRTLGVAFAPGFEIPDSFIEGSQRLTYSSYTGARTAFDEYSGERSLPERAADTGKPTLAIMGSEEQIVDDPRAALDAYREAGARTEMIEGVGHSPNVESPAETAALVLGFASMAR